MFLHLVQLKKAVYRLPRTGSTSLIKNIAETHNAKAVNGGLIVPPHLEFSYTNCIRRSPTPPDGYEKILVSRDPIERFRSACGRTGKTPETAISELELNIVDPHFKRLTDDKWDKIFRFPDQLEELAEYLEIPPLLELNASETKPDLTQDQIDFVLVYYAVENTIWNSIQDSNLIS